MKVLGILGSPRIGGNSDILLSQALAGAKAAGADVVEKIILDRKHIAGCKDCKKCNKMGVCAIKDDMAEIQKQILDAYAVIQLSQVGLIAFAGIVANVRLLQLLRELAGSRATATRI